MRRREHLDRSSERRLRPPAHEPFGITEGRHPLRSVGHAFVKIHLHHSLLILRREQREHRGRLQIDAPDPLIFVPAALVVAIPIGERLSRVNRRAAGLPGFGHQGLVVFSRRLVAVRADDLLDRVVAIAVAPVRDAILARPHVGQLPRRVASRVTLVGPVRAIQVEVLRREQIDGQWRHARRRCRRRLRSATASSSTSTATLCIRLVSERRPGGHQGDECHGHNTAACHPHV